MRAAVVYYRDQKSSRNLEDLAKGLLRGLQTYKDMVVDLLVLEPDSEIRLSGYGYIALGVPVTSWFKGNLPPYFQRILGQCGHLVGKRAFAFVPTKVTGAQKTLGKLMAAMENEGMLIRYSEILLNKDHAEEVGSQLKVD